MCLGGNVAPSGSGAAGPSTVWAKPARPARHWLRPRAATLQTSINASFSITWYLS